MVKAICIHANGGPEVMRWEEIALPLPGAGEARVRHTAIGINYSDLNVRRGGFYLARPLRFPVVLGNEAAVWSRASARGLPKLRSAIASLTPACAASSSNGPVLMRRRAMFRRSA